MNRLAKTGFLVSLVVSVGAPVWGQWTNCAGTSHNTCTTDGVGIGKLNPIFPLDVQQASSGFIADFVSSNGTINQGLYISTSTTPPYETGFFSSGSSSGTFGFYQGNTAVAGIANGVEVFAPYKLAVQANASTPANAAIQIAAQDDGPSYPFGILFGTPNYWKAQINAISTDNSGGGSLAFLTGSGITLTERMRITSGGNVGIGLQNPIYPLSVKGTVGAGEVIVTNTSGWSDYVFDLGYRLTPLDEVADFVKANHHLPAIPSAKEVAENGVSLGEMQAKLLAKIEELTLHTIEISKRVMQLEQENSELRNLIKGR